MVRKMKVTKAKIEKKLRTHFYKIIHTKTKKETIIEMAYLQIYINKLKDDGYNIRSFLLNNYQFDNVIEFLRIKKYIQLCFLKKSVRTKYIQIIKDEME